MPEHPRERLPIDQLALEFQLVLCCAGLKMSEPELAQTRRLLEGPVDWPRVLRLADWHRITALLHHHLNSERFADYVPDDARETLSSAYRKNSAMHAFRTEDFVTILRALEAEDLPVIVLKGAALVGPVYVDPGLRSMGDIDVLVREEHLEEAYELIRGFGFTPRASPYNVDQTRQRHRHYPRLVSPEGITDVEVHRHLVGLDSPLRFDIEQCWERSRLTSIEGAKARTLGSEDLLYHLCVGFFLDRRGFYKSYTALRQLTDIVETVRQFADGLDWDRFIGTVRSRRALGPVHSALWTARELLSLELDDEVLRSLEPRAFDETMAGDFIRAKVIETRPWFLHELVSPTSNTRLDMLRAALRRFLFSRSYLRVKYWPAEGRWREVYRDHLEQILRFLARCVRRPGRLSRELRVDRWMNLLESPRGTAG